MSSTNRHMDIIWLCITAVALLGSSSTGLNIVACGRGPYTLESDNLRIHLKENQSATLLTKNVSQLSLITMTWWTKNKAMWPLFYKNARSYRNGTNITLSAKSEMDGIQMRYKMDYTDQNGTVHRYKSATATVKLRETAGLNFAGNYSSNNSIKVVTGMSSTLSCFSAEVGSIQTFTLYKNHDKGPPTPINTSRYNHTNGCLRMGPLHASDSGTYTVILEDCLSAHTSFSLQLEVEGPSIAITSATGPCVHTLKSNLSTIVYVKIHCQVTVSYKTTGKMSHLKVFRNQQRIKSSENITISNSNLTIPNVTLADCGVYRLTVGLEDRASSTEFTLVVYRQPILYTTPSQQPHIANRTEHSNSSHITNGTITTTLSDMDNAVFSHPTANGDCPDDQTPSPGFIFRSTEPSRNDISSTGKDTSNTTGFPSWAIVVFVIVTLTATILLIAVIYRYRFELCVLLTCQCGKETDSYWNVQPRPSNLFTNVDAISTVGSDVVSTVIALQTVGNSNPNEPNYINLAPPRMRPKRFLSDDGYDHHMDPPQDNTLSENNAGLVETSGCGILPAAELEMSIDTVASDCHLLKSGNMKNGETKGGHPIYATLEDEMNGKCLGTVDSERRQEGHEEIVTNSVPGNASQQNSSGNAVKRDDTPKKDVFSLYENIEDRRDTAMDSKHEGVDPVMSPVTSPSDPFALYAQIDKDKPTKQDNNHVTSKQSIALSAHTQSAGNGRKRSQSSSYRPTVPLPYDQWKVRRSSDAKKSSVHPMRQN